MFLYYFISFMLLFFLCFFFKNRKFHPPAKRANRIKPQTLGTPERVSFLFPGDNNMKRFTVETVTKDKLYILFEYLKRSYASEELEPFNIEEVDTKPLEGSTHIFFDVNNEDKGYIYEVEVSDFYVYIHNKIDFDLKFDINEFCLVLEYQDTYSFYLRLQSKSKDEDEFKQSISLFTSYSTVRVEKNINMRRVKAHFELSADKTETID